APRDAVRRARPRWAQGTRLREVPPRYPFAQSPPSPTGTHFRYPPSEGGHGRQSDRRPHWARAAPLDDAPGRGFELDGIGREPSLERRAAAHDGGDSIE